MAPSCTGNGYLIFSGQNLSVYYDHDQCGCSNIGVYLGTLHYRIGAWSFRAPPRLRNKLVHISIYSLVFCFSPCLYGVQVDILNTSRDVLCNR